MCSCISDRILQVMLKHADGVWVLVWSSDAKLVTVHSTRDKHNFILNELSNSFIPAWWPSQLPSVDHAPSLRGSWSWIVSVGGGVSDPRVIRPKFRHFTVDYKSDPTLASLQSSLIINTVKNLIKYLITQHYESFKSSIEHINNYD